MATEPSINMDGLLIKLILQEATEEDRAQVEKWLEESEENEKYFADFKLIWAESKKLEAKSIVDEELAWERFRKRTSQVVEEQEAKVVDMKSAWWQKSWSVAALIICAIGVGWFLYLNNAKKPGGDLLMVRADNQMVTDTLPDGSVVVLNKHSSISYNNPFTSGQGRHITLSGEAFFTVTPDKEKPFVISVKDVTVKVVGTSFNIKDNKNATEVVVETGIVEVSKKAAGQVKLHPKQKVTVERTSADFKPEMITNDFYAYYRTGKLVCNDLPLSELVATLNDFYNAHIVIENQTLNNLRINTTFNQQTLPEILTVISNTFDITIQHKEDQIILK